MIQVTYNEVGDEMILRAEGHAGYAEKGKDIVCAAVSVLMQTLACSVGTCMGNDGKGFSVVCKKSNDNIAKFELVTDGLALLQREYPENVRYINATERKTKALELQLFAEGGDGGSGAGETSPSAGADSSPDRGALGREENSALGEEENAAPDEAEGRDGESKGEEEKKLSPAERRKKFGQLMSGEYKDLMEEYTDTVSRAVEQRITASPEMRGLLEAIAEKYGTDATDLVALTEAVKNGVVKDDSYFEKIAMEKGVSVKTARELDKLETQNRRLTAQQEAAAQMQKAAQEQARIAQIQAQWDAEAEVLKAKYPEFDREEVLANPEVGKMMRAGCSMEAAYRAAYFDRLMARQTAATAQQTEQGVLNRVQQRGSRPSENGTRPGGAVQTRMDVEHMSRKDREALEKRVLRGEIITF
nr:MAG TPA: YsxB-like protein [Caudoviricetes sp.]